MRVGPLRATLRMRVTVWWVGACFGTAQRAPAAGDARTRGRCQILGFICKRRGSVRGGVGGVGDRFRQIPQMESRICPITRGLCRLRCGSRSVQILTQRSSVNESDDILCLFASKKQCCSVLWLPIYTVMCRFRLRTGRLTSNKLLGSLMLTSHNTVNFILTTFWDVDHF